MIDLQNRAEINKDLDISNFFPPFFSALIPELGRPHYLKLCVESVHCYADLPVEIIVHDDGSSEVTQRQILEEVRNKVSTVVLTTGHNTGLARSFNRLRSMSSSEYLIGFNSDTYMTSSFLKRMKTALDLPYVGVVNVVPKIEDGPGVYVAEDGTKMILNTEIPAFHCAGIRRSVWDMAGGWDENVQTTASDVGFMGAVFGLGLFSVLIEGSVINEMWLADKEQKNNDKSKANPQYVGASSFTRGDNNLPPLFGWPKNLHDQACERRREYIWHGVNDYIQQNQYFPFWYNSHFQNQVFRKIFLSESKIDWEAAKMFGHDRWREQVSHDFKLER